MLLKITLFSITLILGGQVGWADTVNVARAENDKGRLPDVLLNAALKRGAVYDVRYPYGEIETLPLSTRINGLKNGELDVFYALATPEYEKDFIPVYIPIYRGMMGMRLAIIKQQNSDLFAGVKNIGDLKAFTAGQGKFWADSKILEFNAVPLVKELKYKNLFPMLEADRFDYFPRGIQEPWAEVTQHASLGLTVDKHIMLWYIAPFYYFVPRSKPALAKHLTEQLELMIEDGSFITLFNEDPYIQSALSEANVAERTIVKLKNPFLSEKTPIDRKELWYTPSYSTTDKTL